MIKQIDTKSNKFQQFSRVFNIYFYSIKNCNFESTIKKNLN